MAGLRELARAYPEVHIYAISPDPTEQSRQFARMIAADHRGEVTFSLLSDPLSRVIDRYGLRDKAYAGQKESGIPHPSVFVLDQRGRIRWVTIESDYRERPSNQEIAAALDAFE